MIRISAGFLSILGGNKMKSTVLKIFVLILLLPLGGCAKLKHLPQLLTLKAVAEETDSMDEYVESQDKKFKKLLTDVQDGKLEKGLTVDATVKRYGDPIYSKTVEHNGGQANRLLYRYAVKKNDSEKVYLFYNQGNQLIDWQYVEAPQSDSKGDASEDL